MRYFSLTAEDKQKILGLCGVNSFEELIAQVPPELRLNSPLQIPPATDEHTLKEELHQLAQMNAASRMTCFLGQGVYDHTYPAVIDQITNRGEFLTAYTPYQPELAQGTLQTIFEFQSMIAELFGMEVSNASLYDGATSLVEAVLMAARVQGKSSGTVVVSEGIYPRTLETLKTYLNPLGFEIEIWSADADTFQQSTDGFDKTMLSRKSTDAPVAVILQSPNRWGLIEDLRMLGEIKTKHTTQSIAYISHPLSVVRYQSPGECGVDIVASEGQSLGVPMGFGGPYLGLFCCRKEHVRQMPGRLVGLSQDKAGQRAFCVTLSTREQHIRREKATSNICSNQNLIALRAGIYLSLMGPQGLERVFDLSHERAEYARKRFRELPQLKLISGPIFNEVGILIPRQHQLWAERIQIRAEKNQMLAGVKVQTPRVQRDHSLALMLAFTEKHEFEDIDRLVNILKEEQP